MDCLATSPGFDDVTERPIHCRTSLRACQYSLLLLYTGVASRAPRAVLTTQAGSTTAGYTGTPRIKRTSHLTD